MDVFFSEEAHDVMLAYPADRGPVNPRSWGLDHPRPRRIRERAGPKHLPSSVQKKKSISLVKLNRAE
jgi:hypothetical protein